MENTNLQNQKGFTLVEIAIVLVIIGLLLGGVLKGQELIENSKIKSVTQDFDGISAAYYAYQDRTGRVPGDNDGADNFDGIISDTGEFWNDLRSEGFITGAAVATGASASGPTHALDGSFIAGAGSATAAFIKNHICATNIESGVAQGIDVKVDDGESTTGVYRATEVSATALPTAANLTTTGDYTGDDTGSVICKEL